MAQGLKAGRKRDKFKAFLGLRPRTPQPPESSVNLAATSSAIIPLPQPQLDGNVRPTMPPSIQPKKVFTKGESFKRDMAILSIAYILQESRDLKKLIHLIVEIRDMDSEGQLTVVLETCVRFSVQLASAPDAHRAEATQAMTAFIETVEKLKTIPLGGDVTSLNELMSMISKDIDKIKPSFVGNGDIVKTEGLSKVLDMTIGPTIGILNVFKEASSLIPVPWVHPLIGTVASILQAVSQTRSNYKDMKQIAVTAGEFVVSCAVIFSESTVGPMLESSLKKLYKALKSIAEECDKLSQLNLFSRYLQQSGHMGDLQGIRQRLNDAMQLFQTENSITIKLDTEELNRKMDLVSLSDLPSHPRYTRNDYFENSRDDALQYVSNWIANGPESVLWMHGAAGLGKSTVAQQLVQLLKSEDRLAGGVFLTNLTEEPPERVVQMVARQLGQMYPRAIANIADAARKLDGPHDKLGDYFTAYIFDPIRGLQYPYQLVCIVDGLDKWRNYESFLAELAHIPLPSPVKFVLTSRTNYSIERAVDKMSTHFKYPLPLASQTVIENYFNHHFSSGDINWRGRKPGVETIRRLAVLAGGLLIWAATARLLAMNRFFTRYPHVIVDQILTSEESVVGQKDCLEDGQLERLYRGAIITLFPPHIRETLRKFLAATIVLQDSLPVGDFAHLTGIPETTTEEIHQRLAAFRTQDDPKTNLITPATQHFHASFVEFITADSVGEIFQAISATEAHSLLAKGCLEIVFVELLPSFRGKTCLYSELHGMELYAIKFWPLHLSNGTTSQLSAPPGCGVDMDIISEEAMRRWATLFLPCIATKFQDGLDPLDNIKRVDLPYKIAMLIGDTDVTTLSYYIQCLKIATKLQPDNFEAWKALGYAYQGLYERSQSSRDLEEAGALQSHFEQRGSSFDLDEVNSLDREALLLCPAPHPLRSVSLNTLADALQSRFQQWGSSFDLDEVISLGREALLLWAAPHPYHSYSLNNLADSLRSRFELQGSSIDLDEAISLSREALLLIQAPYPDRFASLNNLANFLQSRFELQGSSIDLDEAISLSREALLLCPTHHPGRFLSLSALANILETRFEEQGTSSDLDEAISLHRETFLLFPSSHPDRFYSLQNLSNALESRFEKQGTSSDLEEAISLNREALLLRPESHPDRSISLNNLADILETRFEEQGMSSDLDEAISLYREALLLCPSSHPDHSDLLYNLANALDTRFDRSHLLHDLTDAISLYEQLLDFPVDDSNRSWALEMLPAAIIKRDALIGNHDSRGQGIC